MISLLKRYRAFLLLLVALGGLGYFNPTLAVRSIRLSTDSLVEMMLVIPPIFVLLGIFDVWVPRETIVRLMGGESGAKGTLLALCLGSFAAGPLYAAFPVAGVLIKKGARFSNIMIFIGAWSTTKIPMLLFEASSMGWDFMLCRLVMNLTGIIVIAHILDVFLPEQYKALAPSEF
ncbi:permease [Desulfoluna spongiiphila]|uniref:Predicted permease n=1 Tax=Desulfoluna spongiiphila TaxID=419481 RepID=A0A1G5HJQ7_9BACT|nr:permease [Desulfoluna spongiiphila]SCY63288.1 Predicted permease [Desulfoluna spongiiphila]VVS93444.1 predicted permease duf318 [Desulfoluna spongiiphila]